ncbi:ATP-binding protein [Undibacterium danionis]|uniref:ATP-binding protein n=1 Tax=Undibacterium danionis TaxID=1812100 RepID=A0ABV6I9X9_9BURK
MRIANEDVLAPNNNPLAVTADDMPVKRLSQEVMEHPLFEHSVLLETPPIDDVFRVVKRVVLLRENGCVFTGESGIGKTDAIARVKAMLHKDFPRLCIFTHDAHNQQISSIRAFFKHFLNTVGQREQKGETYDLRSRLVRIIVDDARISGMKLVVIFIDEANAMHLNDFNFLKDVYNDLSKEGIQLLTVLMGQAPDMQQVIDDLRVKGRNDLVGRFAMRVHQMRGFSSVEDVQVIFRSIDRRNLVDFFLPKACKSGFRLENESQNFFDAIALAVTSSPDVAITFPARQTFLAIRAFLLDAAEFDAEEIKLPKNVWHEAVAYSQLQDAIIRMNGRNSLKAKTHSQKK